MKKSIFLSLLVFALVGHAKAFQEVGPDSSWNEIKSSGLIPGFSSIFIYGIGFTVDELCVEEGNLRPMMNHHRLMCVEYKPEGDTYICARYKMTHYSTPINHEEIKCLQWEISETQHVCVKSEKVMVDYPLEYNVTVYEMASDTEFIAKFKKHYSIPMCQ